MALHSLPEEPLEPIAPEPFRSWRVRSWTFVEPAQMLVLAGIVCLVMASRMRLLPEDTAAKLGGSADPDFARFAPIYGYISLSTAATYFAAIAGYFVCFWPGKHPIRRTLLLVCLPALASLSVVFGCYVQFSAPAVTSVLDTGHAVADLVSRARQAFAVVPPGFVMASAGMAFLVAFCVLLVQKRALLPLRVFGEDFVRPDGETLWRRLPLTTWMLIGPLDVVGAATLLAVIAPIIFLVVLHHPSFSWNDFVRSPRYSALATLLEGVVLLGMVALFVGRDGIKIVRERLCWPSRGYALLGLLFPVALVVVISGLHNVADRVRWATSDLATVPPTFHAYFRFSNPWLLLMFGAAFAEECILRGLLQPSFIGKYGMNRGIYLSGLVWAAFHFHGDRYGASIGSAVLQLGIRIGLCLAQSFVFAWLTLRSRSLLPSTIAHTLYNVGVLSATGAGFAGSREFVVVFWALLAVLLFRHWPPADEAGEEPAEPGGQLALEQSILSLPES